MDNALYLQEYWGEVASHMPDWRAVLTQHKTAIELRAEKIASHSTVLRALGGLGLDLMKDDNWRDRLKALESIDWSKKNPDWENVCIIANSVISNRQARAATKAYIKAKLSMDLTESEQRSIEKKVAQSRCLRIKNDEPGGQNRPAFFLLNSTLCGSSTAPRSARC